MRQHAFKALFCVVGVTCLLSIALFVSEPEPSTCPLPNDNNQHHNRITIESQSTQTQTQTQTQIPPSTPSAYRIYNTNKEICDKKLQEIQNSDRSEYIFEFSKELDMLLTYIRCGVPFSIIRAGDGEYALTEGKPWSKGPDNVDFNNDHWGWKGGEGKLVLQLRQALSENSTDFYIALPCEDMEGAVNHFFARLVTQPTRYVSYATVFINRNYQTFKKFLLNELIPGNKNSSNIILVVNEKANVSSLTWAKDVFLLPNDGMDWFETEGPRTVKYFTTIAKSTNDTTFLFSGGPMAKVLVWHMWNANKNNQYIDLGSASDEIVKGFVTRPYTDPNSWFGRHFCSRYRKGDNNRLQLKPS